MISAVATALGAATVVITLMSGGFTAAESTAASGTLIDAQIVEVYVFLLAASPDSRSSPRCRRSCTRH